MTSSAGAWRRNLTNALTNNWGRERDIGGDIDGSSLACVIGETNVIVGEEHGEGMVTMNCLVNTRFQQW